MISTLSPGWTRPAARTAWRAVSPETGSVAASSKERPAGLRATRVSGTTASSAKDPSAVPITSSPTATVVTRDPTSATTPDTSRPGTGCLGRRSPNARRTA